MSEWRLQREAKNLDIDNWSQSPRLPTPTITLLLRDPRLISWPWTTAGIHLPQEALKARWAHQRCAMATTTSWLLVPVHQWLLRLCKTKRGLEKQWGEGGARLNILWKEKIHHNLNKSEDGAEKAGGDKQEGRKRAIKKPSGKNGFRAQKEELLLGGENP